MLNIFDLKVSVEKKEIVNGISLTINPGEVHAIMGPNGSGKSTFANALMGHPRYTVTHGTVELDGTRIDMELTHVRARAGLFLAFQYPMEIAGVSVLNFLRTADRALHPTDEKVTHPGLERRSTSFMQFRDKVAGAIQNVGFKADVIDRSLNEGFSGGEKKKAEIVQAEILDPKYIILDEIDSGLDIDALKLVADRANMLREKGKGLLVITHYARLLHHLKPTHVHVMVDGKIVKSGGPELAQEIEHSGYQHLNSKLQITNSKQSSNSNTQTVGL